MIFDKSENLTAFASLSGGMATAIAWLQQIDLAAADGGRIDIDGDNVYAMVQTAKTRNPMEAQYEAHRRYIDLQYLITGSELILVTDTASLPVATAYDEEKDVVFLQDGAWEVALPMTPGRFAILYPQDAHKPCCTMDDSVEIRKCVIKIRV